MTPSGTFLQHAQILDSALPIGAFSHSFGLETLIYEGQIQSGRDLQEFIEAAIFGAWSQSDCLLIKGAFTLENIGLWRLDALMDAARVSRETRDGTRKMGRQALKLARAIHPQIDFSNFETALQKGECVGSWPLVYGLWTGALGVDLASAATGYLYSCCAATVGCAVRLSLVGQTAAQAILAKMSPAILAAWHEVEARDPFDFCSAMPGLEIAQLRHEWMGARLFMS